MKPIKNDPALANLPDPVAITPDQLTQVVGGSSLLFLAVFKPIDPVLILGRRSPLIPVGFQQAQY